MQHHKKRYQSPGFTIVELIIVIIVIGILVTLAVVGYGGVLSNARDKAVLSDVDGVASEITRYSVKNSGTYGSAVNWYSGGAANANIKFSPSDGNIIDVVATSDSYCIRAYNPSSKTYNSLSTAYTKGSSNNTCATLPPSSGVLALNPIVNGGVVTTVAGMTTPGFVNDTGTAARFDGLLDITVNDAGNLYVADKNNRVIRQITPAGVVTTFSGGTYGYLDGAANVARFIAPQGIAIDSTGVLYVTDYNRIRKIAPDGSVTTLAGRGDYTFMDGTGTEASFNNPYGLTVDMSGNVYVADYGNHRIRKITPSGVVTTLAGSGVAGELDGTGSAAQIGYPTDVAIDHNTGNLYIVDESQKIRKITPAGVVSTFAGSTWGYADGTGTAAKFWTPQSLVMDLWGNIYVSDTSNNRIRKVTAGGIVTTLAGSSSGYLDGIGTAARIKSPYGITVSPTGILYIVEYEDNRIRKIQ